MQWDSWDYLNSVFTLREKVRTIPTLSHFWRGKRISRVTLKTPMIYVSRLVLDNTLNDQQQPAETTSKEVIHVNASGVENHKGDWIGFQGSCEPVEDLEMHYGRGLYLGIAPTLEEKSHVAFIVKRNLFRNTEDLRHVLQKELGLNIQGPMKGTKAIHYHASSFEGLAVGDAKLTTHPFLGLGMKHAIFSARLLAELIASGRKEDYSRLHRRLFWKYRWASRVAGGLYDSPNRFILWPVLKNQKVFLKAYRWLHSPFQF